MVLGIEGTGGMTVVVDVEAEVEARLEDELGDANVPFPFPAPAAAAARSGLEPVIVDFRLGLLNAELSDRNAPPSELVLVVRSRLGTGALCPFVSVSGDEGVRGWALCPLVVSGEEGARGRMVGGFELEFSRDGVGFVFELELGIRAPTAFPLLLLFSRTTSSAKTLISSLTYSGLRCPNNSSLFRPAGYEHSRNICVSFPLPLPCTPLVSGESEEEGEAGAMSRAASAHTARVRGRLEMESGSTSPRKRNSWPVVSFRMKKAVDS